METHESILELLEAIPGFQGSRNTDPPVNEDGFRKVCKRPNRFFPLCLYLQKQGKAKLFWIFFGYLLVKKPEAYYYDFVTHFRKHMMFDCLVSGCHAVISGPHK